MLTAMEAQRPAPQSEQLLIEGGRPLNGRITVAGSKNAALYALAAPLLTAEGLLLPIANAIVVIDPSSGDELRRIPMDGVTAREIVVTDGGTYVRTASGSIVAFR